MNLPPFKHPDKLKGNRLLKLIFTPCSGKVSRYGPSGLLAKPSLPLKVASMPKDATIGIKNLKVGYNKVFGYYLEVTRSYYEMVPENYIRKQTLANAERYITPELKEMEGLVLNAEAKINKMEYDLFSQLRGEIEKHIKTIQETSDAVASLDVLTAFASVSSSNGYIRPEINSGDEIEINVK